LPGVIDEEALPLRMRAVLLRLHAHMPVMLPNFAAVATLRHHLGWCRANTRRADGRIYWGSANTYGACWYKAREP
jgi:hypothetical protein